MSGDRARHRRRLPSPAFVLSAIALVCSLSVGGAVAANHYFLPPNSVGFQELQGNAVGQQELMANAVANRDIRGQLHSAVFERAQITGLFRDMLSNIIALMPTRDEVAPRSLAMEEGPDPFAPGSLDETHVDTSGPGFESGHLEPATVGPREIGVAPTAMVARVTDFTVPHNGIFNLPWDAESADTGGMHSCCLPGMSPPIEEIQIPRAGIYRITVAVQWSAAPDNASGRRVLSVIRGATDIVYGDQYFDTRAGIDVDPTVQVLSKTAELQAGDVLVLGGTQSTNLSGGGTASATIRATPTSPRMEVTWLSPAPGA